MTGALDRLLEWLNLGHKKLTQQEKMQLAQQLAYLRTLPLSDDARFELEEQLDVAFAALDVATIKEITALSTASLA